MARSTPFPAERDAAIRRGLAICARFGLDPDDFDIPGRVRSRRGAGASFRTSAFTPGIEVDMFEAMRRMEVALQAARERAGAAPDEAPYDAQRRNFDAETRAASERDARRAGR